MRRLVAIKNRELSNNIKLQMKELMTLINNFDLEDEDEKIIVNNSRNRLKALLDQLNSGNIEQTIEEIKDIAEDITENVDIDISDNIEIDNIVEDIEDNDNLTEKDQFIKKCENSGEFDDYQITQIVEGLEGLTMKQVKVFADPKFNSQQMYQICTGFEQGLTMDQVKVFAKPEFNWEQMRQIRYGFKAGLTMEQVKIFANSKFNWRQMTNIIKDFKKGSTIEDIKEKYQL